MGPLPGVCSPSWRRVRGVRSARDDEGMSPNCVCGLPAPYEKCCGLLQVTGGGFLDTEGTVRFRAHYVERNRPGAMEELSRFVVHDGDWLYVGPI
jgi:uncharacterized protein YchJ